MGLASRQRTRAVLAALAVVCVLAAIDGALLWRAQGRNAAIDAGTVPADAKDLPPEMRFAQAAALAASGTGAAHGEAALNAFTALQGDNALGQAARFNSANLLLRQAERVRAGNQPGQAIPLIELAKETLRELLRHDPAFWDARYNLERAQRLLPDPEEADTTPEGPQRSAERAATTMRAFSPGLP
jgi:mxaK protein